jgi:hypothetical protein
MNIFWKGFNYKPVKKNKYQGKGLKQKEVAYISASL